jgi:hypothetical protein
MGISAHQKQPGNFVDKAAVQDPNVADVGGTRDRSIHEKARVRGRVLYLGEVGLPAMELNPAAEAKAPVALKGSRIFAVLFRRVLHLAYDFALWVVGLQGE